MKVTASCDIAKSFRVDQMIGMFDLKPTKKASITFDVELPGDDEEWQIGAIVGASGSGKTTVAREAYGSRFIEGGYKWPKGAAVVDGFDKSHGVKDIAHMLTSVGFSSPPSWVKPYGVLSRGEQFRCDLARALLSPGDVVAVDEFTSVVDRTVAKIGSAAVSKAIRKGRVTKQFVAVSCHYDILDWLEPDWVLDMASQQLARGCLQRYKRPEITLRVARVCRSSWELFRRHHYLNTSIMAGAICFAAFWGERPVAFCSHVHRMTRNRKRSDKRAHRTVTLPDFQGIGIGNRLSNFCASLYAGLGSRVFSTTSHPAFIAARKRNNNWRLIRFGRVGATGKTGLFAKEGTLGSCSMQRITAGFQYCGPAMQPAQAQALLDGTPIKICLSGAARAALNRFQSRERLLTLEQLDVGEAALRELTAAGFIKRVGRRTAYGLA